jgi:exodeoxyribonuclease VII small subunit
MSEEKLSFRAELERLEAIVRSLEGENLDLDQALELFQEGVGRLKNARELLAQSELTVQRVLEESDGTISTENLDL